MPFLASTVIQNLLQQKSRCGGSGFLRILSFSDSCNKTRCGSFPHHTHHITNHLVHFLFWYEAKLTTEKFKEQINFGLI